jgi:CrcB protein
MELSQSILRIAPAGRACQPLHVASYVMVFLGGGIGAVLRHWANRALLGLLGPGFPYATAGVNLTGGFLMGVVAQLFLVRTGLGSEARLFLTTGILGGFTTFSAFSLELALMWQRGAYGGAAAYAAGSVLLSVAALFAGMGAVRALT